MATNRRALRRKRKGSAAEAKAWSTAFECRFDFFGDLQHDLGYPPRFDRSEGFLEAAEDAWHRLGRIHLASRDPSAFNRRVPWALEHFGEP